MSILERLRALFHKKSRRSDKDMAELAELMKTMRGLNDHALNIARGNASIEDQYVEDPEYGLVPDKPVFVRGFGQNRRYLDNVCCEDGRSLHYNRDFSMAVDGIEGNIDHYTLYLANGTVYKEIYMSVYGSKNSEHTPQGLKFKRPFVDDEINKILYHG